MRKRRERNNGDVEGGDVKWMERVKVDLAVWVRQVLEWVKCGWLNLWNCVRVKLGNAEWDGLEREGCFVKGGVVKWMWEMDG